MTWKKFFCWIIGALIVYWGVSLFNVNFETVSLWKSFCGFVLIYAGSDCVHYAFEKKINKYDM